MSQTRIRDREGLGVCNAVLVETLDERADLEPGDYAVFEERRALPGNVIHVTNGDAEAIGVLAVRDGRQTLLSPTLDGPLDLKGYIITGVLVERVREHGHGHTTYDEFVFGLRVPADGDNVS